MLTCPPSFHFLSQSAPEEDGGGHRGRGAVTPITSSRRCRRFKPKELDGFVFEKLRDELVVDDIYLRVLVRDAARERASAGEGEGGHGSGKVAAAAAGLGQGLELPSDLLVSTRKALFAFSVFPELRCDRHR